MTFVILYRLSLCAYVILSLAAILLLSCELAFWFALRLSWCLVLWPVRQGNLNDEVQILQYVTEGSFDGYMWQTLERKARFIGQVIRGRLDAREIGDIGDTALSYSEVKALATGNPLLMDKAEADTAVARLRRGERAHGRNQDALHHAVTRHEQDIAGLTRLTQDIDAA